MTLIEDTEVTTMGKTYNQIVVKSVEDLDIFELNSENVRDWDVYQLKAVVSKEGILTFQTDKDAPTQLQGLVDSLLVYDGDSVTVNVHTPLMVAPKNKETGKYVLLAGNSRIVLIREMFQALEQDLTADEAAKFSFGVNPINYQIKGDYTELDLYTYQISDNQLVPLKASQTFGTINKIKQMIVETAEDPSLFKGRDGAAKLRTEVLNRAPGLSVQTYYNAAKFAEIAEKSGYLMGLVDNGLIQNPELAIDIWRFLNKREVAESEYDEVSIWESMMAQVKNSFPTKKHFQKTRKQIEEALGLVEKQESNGQQGEADYDSDYDSETDDGDEQPVTTPKMEEMARLREMPRDELNSEVINAIATVTDKLVNVDPVDYETEDLITLRLHLAEIEGKIGKVKTANQKALIKAEKEAEKQRKEAIKAMEKQAKIDAKKAAEQTEEVTAEL